MSVLIILYQKRTSLTYNVRIPHSIVFQWSTIFWLKSAGICKQNHWALAKVNFFWAANRIYTLKTKNQYIFLFDLGGKTQGLLYFCPLMRMIFFCFAHVFRHCVVHYMRELYLYFWAQPKPVGKCIYNEFG